MKAEKKGKRIIPVILILGIWLVLAQTAAAAGKAEIALTVSQDFEFQGQDRTKLHEEGAYRFRAESPNAPMPEESTRNEFVFPLKGKKADRELPLSFTENGTYVYTLLQTTKDQKNYSYDRNVYTITVYVGSNEKGQKVSQVTVENKNGEKCGKIEFHNSYRENEKADSQSPSEKEASSAQKASVKTADSSDTEFWLTLCALSLTAGLLLISLKKKNQD